MPSAPRREIVADDEVGVYHCRSRVVQQARLYGVDPVTGRSYSHRKAWVEQRLPELSRHMAVEPLDFAIMDNHLHLMLRNRPDVAVQMDPFEVIHRWCHLCPTTGITQHEKRYWSEYGPIAPSVEQISRLADNPVAVACYRKRLSSLSWFMRLLNQPLAVRANRESGTKGRFFAERYRCTRIEDEAGLLACSMYINLNPIRAGIVDRPELAEHTSAFLRIAAMTSRLWHGGSAMDELAPLDSDADAWLAPVYLDPRAEAYVQLSDGASGSDARLDADWLDAAHLPLDSVPGMFRRTGLAPRLTNQGFLPIPVDEYLKLLDWSGRQLRSDRQAAQIPEHLSPILERLGVNADNWVVTVNTVGRQFRTSVGHLDAMRKRAAKRGRTTLYGITSSIRAFD
ncbi:MAG: hypothetical protein U0795_22600 [Pirellulales bacterium]